MTDRYSALAKCMDCTPEEVPTLIQQHAPWNGKAVCDDVLRERAAVVAWLRTVAPNAPTRRGADELAWCADRIERGEHRREGDTP